MRTTAKWMVLVAVLASAWGLAGVGLADQRLGRDGAVSPDCLIWSVPRQPILAIDVHLVWESRGYRPGFIPLGGWNESVDAELVAFNYSRRQFDTLAMLPQSMRGQEYTLRLTAPFAAQYWSNGTLDLWARSGHLLLKLDKARCYAVIMP